MRAGERETASRERGEDCLHALEGIGKKGEEDRRKDVSARLWQKGNLTFTPEGSRQYYYSLAVKKEKVILIGEVVFKGNETTSRRKVYKKEGIFSSLTFLTTKKRKGAGKNSS